VKKKTKNKKRTDKLCITVIYILVSSPKQKSDNTWNNNTKNN